MLAHVAGDMALLLCRCTVVLYCSLTCCGCMLYYEGGGLENDVGVFVVSKTSVFLSSKPLLERSRRLSELKHILAFFFLWA